MTKVMGKTQRNKVVEDEVMFCDVNPVVEGDNAYIKPTPCSRWITISISEFIQWLFDTGRVDHCDHDQEYVSVNGCGNTYQQFWRELSISRECDGLVWNFLTLKTIAA